MSDSTESLSATEFAILNLKQQVAERDERIKDLEHRIETMDYFFTIHRESIRKVMERDTEAMRRAKDGEIEKPVLREIKDEARPSE